MTYFEIYEKVKEALKNADAGTINGKLAIEFFITGEGEGKFYILVDGGQHYVEPYDYVDNDARLIADAETIIKIATGKLKPETAYFSGDLKIEGDVGRALELKSLIDSAAPVKKPRRTKAEIEADKEAKAAAKAAKEAEKAEKEAAKKAEKEAAATEKKAAAKKPAAKKTAKTTK